MVGIGLIRSESGHTGYFTVSPDGWIFITSDQRPTEQSDKGQRTRCPYVCPATFVDLQVWLTGGGSITGKKIALLERISMSESTKSPSFVSRA